MIKLSLRLGYDGGGMVAADIVKSSENAVAASDKQNRFSDNLTGDVLAGFAQLVRPAAHLLL